MTAQIAMVSKEEFVTPTFGSRVISMLKLDFYRLFHTPVFYIMLLIAAIIPAMVLSMSGVESTNPQTGATEIAINFDNTWQLIESTGGSAVANNPPSKI